MIYYLVTPDGKNAMEQYVNSWGPEPGSRIRFLLYEELPGLTALASGTYIFSDLERLSTLGLQVACQAWKALSMGGSSVRLLNNPSRVLCRYDLLRTLFDEGKNLFKAIRANEAFDSLHYPVFVREENAHTGSLTPLIHKQQELVSELRSLQVKGYRLHDLLVVEFCDTSDAAGVFRKYSAFIVGGEIIPRHVIFSRHWNVKKPDLTDSNLTGLQEEYLSENPHKGWLQETFKLSGIEYGRIDYSLMGNTPQIWEINTNPTVRKLTPRLTSAFEAIDQPVDSSPSIPFEVNQDLIKALAMEKRQRRKALRFQKLVRGLTGNQLIRPMIPVMKSLIRSLSK